MSRSSGGFLTTAKLLLPWVLTAAIFYYLFRKWPIGNVIESLSQARWGLYLALMLPYSIAYFMIDTLAVTTAVRRFNAPVRYRDVLPVRAVTYVLALVNSNVGQGGLALWLYRRNAGPLLSIVGTFVFLAAVEIYQLVIYSSLGVAVVGTALPHMGGTYALLYAVLLGLLLYFNGLRALGVDRPASGVFGTLGRARLSDWGILLAIKSVSLLLAIATHWAALRLFGMQVPFVALVANLPLIFLASAVPLTVGKLHASLAWAYLLGGYAPPESLIAYSVASHLTFLVMNALIGVAFLPRTGREIWEMAKSPPPRDPTSAAERGGDRA